MRVLMALVIALATVSSSGPAAAEPARWTWPVGPPHAVVRRFEAPATGYAAGHRGIDVAAPVGTPVRAPDDGVVAFAGRLADRGVLSIDHAGVRSSFEPVTPTVAAGDRVVRGEAVAVVASGGGHPLGTLHIGARVREGTAWDYVDPLLFLGGARHAVLLPLSAFP